MNERQDIHFKTYRIALFDLDGVITATASVHAASWKRLFDGVLLKWSQTSGVPFVPFDRVREYRSYVDGKPRVDGIRRFFESRNIPISEQEIQELGNRKNAFFLEALSRDGVDVYESSLAFARYLKGLGLKIAVVSSSKNGRAILSLAGLDDFFSFVLDGNDAEAKGLPGKPAADTYLAAAEALGVAPDQAIVIEDSLAGVQSGRAGGFGLVIALDHDGLRERFLAAGADIAVAELAGLIKGDLR